MDDSDVRSGRRGRLGHSLNPSLTKAPQEPLRLSRLLNPPTFLFHHPLRRLPAPRSSLYFFALISFLACLASEKVRNLMDLVLIFFPFCSVL